MNAQRLIKFINLDLQTSESSLWILKFEILMDF